MRALPILMLLAASLRGQEPVVKTEILAVTLDQPVDELFIHTGKAVESFSANLTGFGLPIAYQGPRRLVLHETAEAFAPREGQVPPPPVASVDLPLNADRTIVVCLQPAKGPLKLVAYDIGNGGMKAGDYRFFNYSKQPVSFIVGGQRFSVPPGKDHVAEDKQWRDETLDLEVQFGLGMEPGKPAKRVYASVWGHRPGRRNYVFVFDGNHPSRPITTRRFHDVPKAAVAAAP